LQEARQTAHLQLDHTEQIFQQLFSAEYGKLCRYALTYMKDAHSAEDIVQDTFIKIWETKRELIASKEIRFYLVTAVRNNCISALRKLKSSNIHFPETAPEPEPEPFFTQTQHREDATEKSDKVAAALNLLPPKCKEVFLLVKMHSMSYKQVAESLDISVKTVENQMGKALRVLRESTVLTAVLALGLFLIVNQILHVGFFALKSVLS
jgi:RNA polymerase sigma-70 factor (ECF subfamily)